MALYPDPGAAPENFIVCHGYNCSHKTRTGFTKGEWRNIEKIFKKKSKDAADERVKIGKAVALMETYMGEVVGTKDDLPKAPIIRKSTTELDCIDETVNTTKYLGFLDDAGLLKFHSVGLPTYKGFMVNGVYPHNSATIVETQTGQAYVVDSYIYENGEKPDIRPLDNWHQYRVEDLQRAENMSRAAAENLTR